MSSSDTELLQALFATSTDTILVDPLRREIWIDGDITEHVSRDFIRGVRHMEALGATRVDIMVNSNGGDVSEGLAIADYIKYVGTKSLVMATKVIGVSYSAGSLISSSGTKGYRYALPNSNFLIHQLSAGGIDGKMEDLASEIRHLEMLNKLLIQQLSTNSGQSVFTITRDVKQETYMSAQQALKYGLIDHIGM